MSQHPDPEQARRAARRLALVTLALLLGFGTWHALRGPASTADDYAQYLLHAEALVDGRPYTDTGYIFSPLQWGVGPPVQSPGYPLTVAPFFALFGRADWIPRLLSLVGGLAFVGLAGAYFARLEPVGGALVALITAAALIQLEAMATPGPDLVFCALLWAVAFGADTEAAWSWPRTVALTALAVAAVLYRIAALPLVPAFFAFGLLNWRRHGIKPFLAGAASAVSFGWVFAVFGASRIPPPPQYVLDAVRAARARPARPMETGPALGGLRNNLAVYSRGAFELQLYPFPWKLANQAYHVLASVPMALGTLLWGARRWRSFGVLLVFAYIAMLLLLSLRASRYLWPLAPVIAYGMVEGVRWALLRARLSPARARRTLVGVASVLVALTLTRVVAGPGPRPIAQDADVQAMFAAVRAEAERAPVRVAFYKSRTLIWETGVPAAPLAGAPTDEAVYAEVASLGLTHAVVGSLDGEVDASVEQWRRLVVDAPERFELVRRSGPFALYRIRPQRDPPGPA